MQRSQPPWPAGMHLSFRFLHSSLARREPPSDAVSLDRTYHATGVYLPRFGRRGPSLPGACRFCGLGPGAEACSSMVRGGLGGGGGGMSTPGLFREGDRLWARVTQGILARYFWARPARTTRLAASGLVGRAFRLSEARRPAKPILGVRRGWIRRCGCISVLIGASLRVSLECSSVTVRLG